MRPLIVIGTLLLTAAACCASQEGKDYRLTLGKVPLTAKFSSDTYTIWGASLVKGPDGLFHLFYSRWKTDLGWAWVTDSEIAHAVGKTPFGPFEFRDVALPRRGREFWDGLCTHNPTIHKFGGKYYLYYMGNTGDGVVTGTPGNEQLNWVHRNNQRIGVAVAESPAGPWQRFDRPLIDVTHGDDSAIDALVTSNPAITQRPDGGFLMVYKVVGKQRPLPNGGPVLHAIATSKQPTGPFLKHDKPTFVVEGVDFPAEDPYIWHQDGKYRAVVKNIEKKISSTTGKSERVFTLVLFESLDGFDWKPSKHHLVSDRTLTWADGKVQKLEHLERPQLYFENGVPRVLLCAADTRDQEGIRRTFNVQIPVAFE